MDYCRIDIIFDFTIIKIKTHENQTFACNCSSSFYQFCSFNARKPDNVCNMAIGAFLVYFGISFVDRLCINQFFSKVASKMQLPWKPGALAANKWVWMFGIFTGSLLVHSQSNLRTRRTWWQWNQEGSQIDFTDRTKEEINVVIKPDSLYEAEMPVGTVKLSSMAKTGK